MTKLSINENSTIMECYEHFELQHNHAANTKTAYFKNCQSFQDFLEAQGVEPIVKNINYYLASKWKSSLEKMSMAATTIKQMIASLKRINNYLINLGILTTNVFREIDDKIVAPDNYHSRALSISELYEVYKKAIKLDEKGKNVLMSTLIAMFSGVRNNTLCKLRVNSITDDGLLNISHMNSNKNSKNKDLSIPLPQELLRRLHDYIEFLELEPEDPLLYGLRGYSLKNKQFNAVTRNLCIELGWMTVRDLDDDEKIDIENETVDGNKVYTRTSKYFTPHAFRYTIPTILSEMGVPKDSLKFLLGHSQFEKGSLPRYIHTVRRQQKQIYTGQLILETILETAFELEQSYNIKLDIEYIEDDLEKVFEIVYRNENEIEQFKNQLITFAFTKAQQELSSMGTPLQHSQHHVQFQHPQPSHNQVGQLQHQQTWFGPKTQMPNYTFTNYDSRPSPYDSDFNSQAPNFVNQFHSMN